MTMKSFSIDKFIAWLTLLSGLSISFVAIYYSVAGLVAIFAAAAIPIIVMGVVLESSKLVATLWLKWNWDSAPRLIKVYLCSAVAVLMFITSMGIFGFLSKAHIDQTASSVDAVARIEQIDKEIARQNSLIDRAEQRLTKIETTGVGNDANIQRQIDSEQSRIDSAYERIQPAIDEQQAIIDNQIKLFQDQLKNIDNEIATLQEYIDNNDVRKVQAIVGTRADGQFGPATASAVQRWQTTKSQERSAILEKIESANSNPVVKSARSEIQRLRQVAENQVAESNKLINRLRNQLGQTDPAEIEQQLDKQKNIITQSTEQVDQLTRQKYELEAQTRKLEAEVGPIKFIADFIYGDHANKNTLEEAVRWMILVIVIVFDPLAIFLLLASQHSFQFFRRYKKQHEPIVENKKLNNISETEEQDDIEVIEKEQSFSDLKYLKSFKSFSNTKPISGLFEKNEIEEDYEIDDDDEVLKNAHPTEKAAMHRWKEENPNDSLKMQRKLLEKGVIKELPWKKYLDVDNDVEEAIKWAEEQAAKKKESISWIEREEGQQVKKSRDH